MSLAPLSTEASPRSVRPLASYGTWGAEGLADALARAEGRPRATAEEVEALREARTVAQPGEMWTPWGVTREAEL